MTSESRADLASPSSAELPFFTGDYLEWARTVRLSPDFTLEEMVVSRTASLRKIRNRPDDKQIESAVMFSRDLLQPGRDRWGRFRVTSGFRCYDLNAAVGGAADSFHQWRVFYGAGGVVVQRRAAVDFQPLDATIEDVFAWYCNESGLPFDLIILERGRNKDSLLDDSIHLQWLIGFDIEPRRLAKRGQTHNRGQYTDAEVRYPSGVDA